MDLIRRRFRRRKLHSGGRLAIVREIRGYALEPRDVRNNAGLILPDLSRFESTFVVLLTGGVHAFKLVQGVCRWEQQTRHALPFRTVMLKSPRFPNYFLSE
jgi:hypothetical protein